MSCNFAQLIGRLLAYSKKRYSLAKSFAFIHPIFSISYNDIMTAIQPLQQPKYVPTSFDSVDFAAYFAKELKSDAVRIKNALNTVKRIASESKELIDEIQESIDEYSSDSKHYTMLLTSGMNTLNKRMQHLNLLLKSYKSYISVKLEETVSQFVIGNLMVGYKSFDENIERIKPAVVGIYLTDRQKIAFKPELTSVLDSIKGVFESYPSKVIGAEYPGEAVETRMELNCELKLAKDSVDKKLQEYASGSIEYLSFFEAKVLPVKRLLDALNSISEASSFEELKEHLKAIKEKKASLLGIKLIRKRSGCLLLDPSQLKSQLDDMAKECAKHQNKLELMCKKLLETIKREAQEVKENLSVEKSDLITYSIILKEIKEAKYVKIEEQLRVAQEIETEYLKDLSVKKELECIEELIKYSSCLTQ